MKKGQVKTYVLNSDGEYVLLTSDEDYIDDEEIDTENLPENIQMMLHSNPFLLEESQITKKYINSIEEFYIYYGNKEVTLDSIVRDDIFEKKIKLKIIRKHFKLWKKDASQYIKKSVVEKKENLADISSNKLKILSPINKFLLFIGIVLSILLIGNVFTFFEYKKIGMIISIAVLVVNLCAFLIIYLQSNKLKEYKSKLKIFNNKHWHIYKKIKSNLKVKYRKLKRYYLDGYKNNMFTKEAYSFKNINIDIKEINSLIELHNQIIKSYNSIGNYKRINVYYHIPLIITYLSTISIFTYVIAMLLIYIYNMIF